MKNLLPSCWREFSSSSADLHSLSSVVSLVAAILFMKISADREHYSRGGCREHWHPKVFKVVIVFDLEGGPPAAKATFGETFR